MATSMKLKIVVDKKNKRVMFAEAKKEFVDFIFHILSLPLGAVQRILNTKTSSTTSLGSIGILLEGLKKLDDEYVENPGKYHLLGIKAPYWGKNTTLLLPEATCASSRETFRGSTGNGGYVKEVVTFMIMDDLVVRPAEPASVITLLKQLSIKDVGDTEKREVTFGTDEAIKLLKASVSSNTVLTDVFLRCSVCGELMRKCVDIIKNAPMFSDL